MTGMERIGLLEVRGADWARQGSGSDWLMDWSGGDGIGRDRMCSDGISVAWIGTDLFIGKAVTGSESRGSDRQGPDRSGFDGIGVDWFTGPDWPGLA